MAGKPLAFPEATAVVGQARLLHDRPHGFQGGGQRREQAGHHGFEFDVGDDVAEPVRRAGALLDLFQRLERLQEVAQLVHQQADGDRRVLGHVHPFEDRRDPDPDAVGRGRVGRLVEGDVGPHQARGQRRDHGQDLVGCSVEDAADVRGAHGRPPSLSPIPSRTLRNPSAAGRSTARSCAK